MWIRLRIASASRSKASAICRIRSGRKVCSVSIHDVSVQAPVVLRTRDVDRQLMRKLGLARRKLTVTLRNGLRFQAASQKFVQSLRTRCELRDGLPPLQDDVARLEAADVDGLPRRDDD